MGRFHLPLALPQVPLLRAQAKQTRAVDLWKENLLPTTRIQYKMVRNDLNKISA